MRWQSGATSIDGDCRVPALMGFTVGFLGGDWGIVVVCGLLFFNMGLTVVFALCTMISVTRSASWSSSGTGWICFGRWLWRCSCPFVLCTPQMACKLFL